MTFDKQPTLSDNLVKLTPLKAEDFEALLEAASDPLIWEQHPAHDRWKRDVFVDFFATALESGGAFLIRDSAMGDVIGSTRYHGFDPESREVEIGWTFLKRSHWGGRFNTAIKALMLDHAFGFVDRVILYAGEENRRSRRAIERIGGRPDGVRDEPDGGVSIRYVVTPEGRAQSVSNR